MKLLTLEKKNIFFLISASIWNTEIESKWVLEEEYIFMLIQQYRQYVIVFLPTSFQSVKKQAICIYFDLILVV